MKQFIACLVLSGLALCAHGQKDAERYKARAEEVRQDIWGKATAEFKVTNVPADMSNESAVIIARAFDITNSSKSRFKWVGIGFNVARRNLYRTVYHERVKINDKNALNEFSTIEYRKKLDNSTRFGFSKLYNTMETYIGAKIIKGDGKEVIVNTAEEVLTKDEKTRQEGKLAISDLQVGDILDYYIDVEEMKENNDDEQGPFTFVMGGDYPMLYINVRLQLDEKAGVQYIAANGAPELKHSTTDDGDLVLKLEARNLAKFKSSMWTSPYRQWPYVILQYKIVGRYESPYSDYKAGTLHKGTMAFKLADFYRGAIPQMRVSADFTPQRLAYEYLGGKKKMRDLPKDSVVKVLFDYWRWQKLDVFNRQTIDVSQDVKYSRANSLQNALYMSYYLQDLDLDHDLLLLCSRNEQSLQNVLKLGDMDAVIRVAIDGKTYYMAFDDVTTRFNEIPVRFQGEEYIAIRAEKGRRAYSFTDGTAGTLPLTSAADNTTAETIRVQMAPSNGQLLQIDRSCSLTGAYRSSEQKRLLLSEDIDKALSKALSEKTHMESLSANKTSAKLVPDFTAAFTKERNDWKKYFKDEIKEQYEEEPKEVTSYEIGDHGLLNSSPSFVYRSSFTMDNFVKKAGNNYIVDAGKLIGKFTKVDEKERNRSMDVYMFSARTFTFDINIAIPEGYTAKGVEELATNMTNESGSFVARASADEKNVKITVTRSFNKAFEPAANWPKLLSLLDAVYEFNNKKILFEKKK
ncbi:MAG: DUF3857 domain-containing protein [Chitinophagaceae bacterium]|nr:MAG: DUF3857 domain-containing protein [Chitinophagaceae bacterium]